VKKNSSNLGSATLLGIVMASAIQAAETNPEGVAFFESKIRPVLIEHCYECHAADSKIIQGGLRVDHPGGLIQGGDTGAAVVPGKADESLLLKALRYDEVEMPPKGKLPESIAKDFEVWIAMGAPDPREATEVKPVRTIDIDEGRKHWAFQPVMDPPLPKVKDATWPLDPLDHFILAKLEDAELQPVADADCYTWLRRVSLDLTGLPPSPLDMEAFVKDNSPRACETVVDRLLNSRAFGERWARHWLDLTGYADMMGTSNTVFAEHAWRYRDYLIHAFNKDKPFDRFVREQIAGDLMPASSPEEQAENMTATGFLMVGDVAIVEPDKPKMVADHIDSQLSKIGTVFMGMTLGCVRCHDHKFDPIGVTDYYGIAGILHSSPSTHKIPFGVWSKLNETALPETPQQLVEREKQEAEHGEKLVAMKVQQETLTEEKKVLVTEVAKLKKKSVAEVSITPIDASASEGFDGSEKASDASINEANNAVKIVDSEKSDNDKEAMAKQLDEINASLKQLATQIQHAEFFSSMVPQAFAMQDGKEPADITIYIRGNPYTKGDVVPRSVIRVASWEQFPAIPEGQSGRLQLADWLSDPRQPLTARVTVNRIWQKLFGEGIVRSVDYFGTRGDVPTHPELLDHLAVRFMRDGWSQKRFIRAIVLSRAYRLGSTNHSLAVQKDPDNRWLWRMNRQRLDAESIRDGLLAISGELTPSLGGPALALDIVENTGALVKSGVNPPNYKHAKPRPTEEFERTIYLPVMRNGFSTGDRLRGFFDFVDPAQIAGQRNQTVASTQSLFLLNNDLLRKHSKKLADRLIKENPDTYARMDRLWLSVFNRPITSDERKEANAFLNELEALIDLEKAPPAIEAIQWQELCHSLFASNQFIYKL